MSGWSTSFLVVAVVFAALDWWAVSRGSKRLEYLCKPAAAMAFLAAAVLLEPADSEARVWLVIALVFCVAGDVFLMLPKDAFIPGLASFAVAQILFVVSFAVREPTALRFGIGLVVVGVGAAFLARRFIGALRRAGQSSMIPPIILYVAVISAMVVSAISGGSAWSVAGAVLFLVSDSFIAEQRFVAPRRWQPMTVIVTYHAASAGLVLGLV